jgi:hypothetical protein
LVEDVEALMEAQTIRSLPFTNVKRLKAHDLKF